MHMLVYCPEYTRQSHLAKDHLTELDSLCQRDYGKSYFKDAILCIDLDSYEQSLTGNNDATMDAAAGVADYHRNKTSSPRHLLIELRLGYESTRHLDLDNMRRKVAHSRDILRPEGTDTRVAFLFDEQVAPKAQSFFARFSRQYSEMRTWDAMDVRGFSNYVFDSAFLPYQPENNLDEIEKGLKEKLSAGGIDAMDGLVKYWLDQMTQYRLRFKHAECRAIAEAILRVLESIETEPGSFEDMFLPLRIEEVKRFL